MIFIGSYAVGGVPALLTGLACAAVGIERRAVSLWRSWMYTAVALIVTLVLFHGISLIFIEKRLPSFEKDLSDIWSLLRGFSVAAFPATTICWVVARRLRLL